MTTSPLSAIISAAGTWIARCIALAPTSSPPNRSDARIVHSGWSPPNSAATMPLKPAEPVNPVDEPSVTKRWDSLPNTRIDPASPPIAPLNVRASVVMRRTGMPA